MRYVDGRRYRTVGEVASAAGVSPQTVRQWERTGRVHGRRTPGGHRLFDDEAVQVAVGLAAERRARGRAAPVRPGPPDDIGPDESAATGLLIRAARLRVGMTQEAVAARADISRSLLSAVERGESGVSMQAFSRIAACLGLPMSELAPAVPLGQHLLRLADRPRTVLDSGVTWEELAASGHALAPAHLLVPPGSGSGGEVVLQRENFVTVLTGLLAFRFAAPGRDVLLGTGDSLVIPVGTVHAWHNPGASETRAIWVEHLGIGSGAGSAEPAAPAEVGGGEHHPAVGVQQLLDDQLRRRALFRPPPPE